MLNQVLKVKLVAMLLSASLLFAVTFGARTFTSTTLETCDFHIYNSTPCTRNPYMKSSGTLAECCAKCQDDNQCQAFTLHAGQDGGVGQCLFSLTAFGGAKPEKGITCGTRVPLPPAPGPPGPTPTPAIPHSFDCGIRRLALSYGTAIVGASSSIAGAGLFEALQLGPDCGDSPPPPPPSAATAMAAAAVAGAAIDYWVAPTTGSDSNTGSSAAQAWKTVERAVTALTSTPAAARPPTTVHLLPGIYHLDSTIALGPEHSGASAASPVVFRAEAAATAEVGTDTSVVLSGGVDLGGLEWSAATANDLRRASLIGVDAPSATVWKATVPEAKWASVPMSSLWAGENSRQWRARWPNGNPEVYCARDLHGGRGCTGFAQASKSQPTKATACSGALCCANKGKPNVFIHTKKSKTLIATGSMRPYTENFNVTVDTPSAAFENARKSFTKFADCRQPANTSSTDPKSFQLERFDTSITGAFWNTAVPNSMFAESWTTRKWAEPESTTVHTYQSEYWGSWIFDVASVTTAAAAETEIHFSRGGFQEARGGGIGGGGGRGIQQDFFVSGALEELDAAREFHFDVKSPTLLWAPNATLFPSAASLKAAKLVAPHLAVLLRVGGTGDATNGLATLAAHIRWEGVEFRHAAQTFMAPYEPTSGGDWAVHRGAAAVVEWANGIHFDGCTFASLGGNALLLQHYVRASVVTRSTFNDIGETPILFLGSANGINGTLGTQPWGNEASHNYVQKWGVWGRQAAGYFEGLAGENNVSFNVFHDGPRAGANFNDGFGGGLHFEGNLLFNVVQDTGEHGSTNSWDRQPMLWRLHGDVEAELSSIAAVRSIGPSNFVFRNSFRGATSNKWALDKDDGSSNYDEHGNIILYGASKDRDGLQRMVRDNLFLYPNQMPLEDTTNTKQAMAFQVNGYAWDFFVNNTLVMEGSDGLATVYSCTGGGNDPLPENLKGNTFLVLGGANASKDVHFSAGACGSKAEGWVAWQAAGFDKGTTLSYVEKTSEELIAMAKAWLPVLSK